MNGSWTDPEKEILRKMAEAGKSVPQINSVLKSRTEDGIRSQARRLGLEIKSLEPEIDYDLYRQLMDGEAVEG